MRLTIRALFSSSSGRKLAPTYSRFTKGAGSEFLEFGLLSFRPANITWRQEVGASAIEASKIAGHATVPLKRQEELIRSIQGRIADARKKHEVSDTAENLRGVDRYAGFLVHLAHPEIR
jgi:hypothetical protein